MSTVKGDVFFCGIYTRMPQDLGNGVDWGAGRHQPLSGSPAQGVKPKAVPRLAGDPGTFAVNPELRVDAVWVFEGQVRRQRPEKDFRTVRFGSPVQDIIPQGLAHIGGKRKNNSL